jgi:16S rRNA (cytosine1402-N4)-methyltransferase
MHIPVLVSEALEWLAVRPEGLYVDATVGAGGHARAILERLTTGRLIGIDKDPFAIRMAHENLQQFSDRLTLVQHDFADLLSLWQRLGCSGADGVLADIGLSQMQLDSTERGFSLKAEGPLDMRMDPSQRLTAGEIVNRYGERELAQLIYQFGEERRSQRIARAIVRARPVRNTLQLAELVAACLGGRRTSRSAHRRERKRSGAATRQSNLVFTPLLEPFKPCESQSIMNWTVWLNSYAPSPMSYFLGVVWSLLASIPSRTALLRDSFKRGSEKGACEP